jgi:hypothetical protein
MADAVLVFTAGRSKISEKGRQAVDANPGGQRLVAANWLVGAWSDHPR